MKKLACLIALLAFASLAASCTTVSVTADNGAKVEIRTDRNVNTLPIKAEGNTVPLSGGVP